ncbi:MAG TPA: PEP-CTERM sorting domain-containing protein [Tepidisphaeraceae bacterium]|nr:PEP-CTERM sorting domain-containing protein [Tepidisphaeraceae bacterium]
MADNHIRAGNLANTSYPTGDAEFRIEVKSVLDFNDVNQQPFARKAYLRFDVSGIAILDPGPHTFSLFVRSVGEAGELYDVYALNAGFAAPGGQLGADWSEAGLTWNNAPGNDVSSDVQLDTTWTTLLGSFSAAGKARRDRIDVPFTNLSSYVNTVGPADLVTIMIVARGTSTVSDSPFRLHDRLNSETNMVSQLNVAVPEPASLAVLGLAGLLAGRGFRVKAGEVDARSIASVRR